MSRMSLCLISCNLLVVVVNMFYKDRLSESMSFQVGSLIKTTTVTFILSSAHIPDIRRNSIFYIFITDYHTELLK